MEKNMLNIFKTKPWLVASLFVATAAFAQQNGNCAPKQDACKPCQKVCPCPPAKVELNPAYNAPANIDLTCSWDVNVNASFLYWQATQSNMGLGVLVSMTDTGLPSVVVNERTINMDYDYKPGFRVGLGWELDHDNWDMQAEYTWFHAHNSRSVKAPTAVSPAASYIAPTVTSPYPALAQGEVKQATSVDSSWRLKMDIVDLNIGRSCYVGKELTMRPSLGLRGAFIRQQLKVENVFTPTNKENARLRTNSWGVGPSVALDANWNLCDGFRIFGNTEADLLYTRYTRSNFTSSLKSFDIESPQDYSFKRTVRNIDTVRTHLDINAGIGYGTYFDCNNWYFDISAGYEFQAFFDQNMFNTNSTPGNLYTQGLTLKARLDF
jgi:hypothetical protein